MISYVECLGGEGAAHGVSTRCWNRGPDDERDELLPRKMATLQPKMEGSLRRRLLSARIHQRHDAIMALRAGEGSGGSPLLDKTPLPPHFQYPGSSPWCYQQNFPPQAYIHLSQTPEAQRKLLLAQENYGKGNFQHALVQPSRSGCPGLIQRGRTGSCPPTLEPRPGYTLPVPSPLAASASFRELEVPPQYHYQPSRKRRANLFRLRLHRGRSSRMEPTQKTPLLHKGIARKIKLLALVYNLLSKSKTFSNCFCIFLNIVLASQTWMKGCWLTELTANQWPQPSLGGPLSHMIQNL